jgi:hypothetical protein
VIQWCVKALGITFESHVTLVFVIVLWAVLTYWSTEQMEQGINLWDKNNMEEDEHE